MIRRRERPDGLPFRVYERRGIRVYSIGYKMPSGKWAFRYECPIHDLKQIAAIKKKAIEDSLSAGSDAPIGGFKGLVDAWFEMQEALPKTAAIKRADSTISENKNEAKNLKKAWGHLDPSDLTKAHAYEYLEACWTATDEKGNPRPRPEKGNKEIALARLIMEWAVKKRVVQSNPFADVTKNKTVKVKRLVSAEEMHLAVEVGRREGGSRHIVAMALKTAWLCVRRSVEVRAIARESITPAGILWADGKDKTKPKILIQWSPELRETMEEALKIKRNKVAGTMYLFGNMSGQKYTKGGWKSVLDDLMFSCVIEAEKQKIPFQRFSLQDCRPLGVTDKLERGDLDMKEVTGHTSDKMIATVYDRRPVKKAMPAG